VGSFVLNSEDDQMAWAFETAAKELQRNLVAMEKAGLGVAEGLVLTALLGELSEEAGEVTSVSTIAELSSSSGLGYDKVGRALLKLREKGFISRRQMVRRAGEAAYTTILPSAFAGLGLPEPGGAGEGASTEQLPDELRELLCGQSWDVVDAVRTAWNNSTPLPNGIHSEIRGGSLNAQRIERLLSQRLDAALSVMEAAIADAYTLEEAKAAGMDLVKTSEGPVLVNVKAFEAACPVGSVRWDWVRDVLSELAFRDLSLVSPANLRDRIAEIAYARVSLPFVKDKAWPDGVRLLARQMQTNWAKPRRIWDSWYVAADHALAVIHRDAENA